VVNTDPAGQFAVFWRNKDDGLCLATDARHLATTGEPNAQYLASSILRCPELTHGQTAFTDVNRVEPGQTIHFRNGQVAAKIEATTSPDSSLTFEEAAANLRQALMEAVELRLSLGRVVTSDCSGGFDSTTLALLGAERSLMGMDVFIQYRQGTGFGDLPFARAVAEETPGLRLHEIYEDIEALPFQLLDDAVLGDEPGGAIFYGNYRQRLNVAKTYGSELHLLGEGGDAVLDWPPEVFSDLAEARRTDDLRQLCLSYARSRALNPADLFAAALDSTHWTLVDDLRSLATFLRTPDADDNLPPIFTWINRPSRAATFLATSMRHLLGDAAERQAEELYIPEDMRRGDYASLKEVQSAGFSHHQTRLIAQSLGVEAHAPYMDRNAIAACLQLPARKRAIPQDHKPVLRRAFRDIMPSVLYSRTSAGTYSSAMYKGFRIALPKINELFGDDSRLAALGVIDLPTIRQQIERVDMGLSVASASFDRVIEAEIWLRRLDESTRTHKQAK
jgi:asparagine synthase (glutamine-hydrolysing)